MDSAHRDFLLYDADALVRVVRGELRALGVVPGCGQFSECPGASAPAVPDADWPASSPRRSLNDAGVPGSLPGTPAANIVSA
ncbi:MAG: hypothetical protein IT356_06325 [Gemmatimonadaceae bacterium]|nr:hypothetical protein [Gemmatimonadaceae bacterium]